MVQDGIRTLSATDGIDTHPGVGDAALSEFETEFRLRLPPEHAEVLRWSNGVEAYDGFYRLFGIGGGGAIDAVAWNHPRCWRFAWNTSVNRYWFIGESAWGAPYAYEIDSFRGGEPIPVYILSGLTMTPQYRVPSFAEFFDKYFVPSAVSPRDQMSVSAREKFGRLGVGTHLVFSPSPLMGVTPVLDNVMQMDAVAAMIIQGDIATQLASAPPGGRLTRVEPYEDDNHRMRLRLIWS